MTHTPTTWETPTDETCAYCSAQYLTRGEVAAGHRCRRCQEAGEPPACRCDGVAFVAGGFHVYRVQRRAFNGELISVDAIRTVPTHDGGECLERCPTQKSHYDRLRRRRLVTLRESSTRKRPVGVGV